MNKTEGLITPGGIPAETLGNPSSNEAGPKDSGEGHLLHTMLPNTQIKTQSERILFEAWQKEKDNNVELEHTIAKLQHQLTNVQKKLDILLDKNNNAALAAQREDKEGGNMEFWTDEEELNKETEWITKSRKNKKRKMAMSPEISPLSQHQHRKQSPANAMQNSLKRLVRPPPIILSKVMNYDALYNDLKEKGITFKASLLNNEQVKINVEDTDEYRKLTKILNDSTYPWHTYENKQTRPIKVVAKKLHYSCKPEKIMEDLKNKGFGVTEVVNLLSSRDRTPLSLFMLSFLNKENIKKIYEIKEILGMKVDIESLKKSKLIPQCKKCQTYGHTQRFCNREPRCVKCAGKHLSRECKKTKQTQPKCVNCGENHPANYRGCEVAKKLQAIRNDIVKKRTNKPAPNRETRSAPVQAKTYSQAVLEPNIMGNKNQDKGGSHDGDNVNLILNKLIEKLDIQEKEFNGQGKLLNDILERLSKLERISNRAATLREK